MSDKQVPDTLPGLLRHDAGPFNVAPYMDELQDFDISEEEKIAFLEALCLIMKTFVDIGWGVDSVQRIFPPLIEQEPFQAAGQFNAEAATKEDDHD